jgi:Lrp/AsnC family leucine-responsive transcriptional regulator
VITRYHAQLDPTQVGLPVQACLVASTSGRRQSAQTARIASVDPRVLEDHRITGTDDHVLRVVAARITELEPLIDALNEQGKPATSFVLSSPMPWAPITQPEDP